MQRTFLLIPHEIAGLPVFGVGWLLILLGVVSIFRIGLARHRNQSIAELLTAEGLMWVVTAVAIVFVLPAVELTNLDNEPVGMAVRGYGVMLIAGVVSAVGLAVYRGERRGIDSDQILALIPWVLIGGLVGARLFFVIQYRDQYIGETITETIGNVLKFTEGGLVVYGSFIGGFLAVAYYSLRNHLPLLKFGDVIVPCLFLGVFFGRIGCLMNGCCYGGRCEDNWAAVQFPPTSQVYQDQLRSGELIGIQYDDQTHRITSVEAGGLAAKAGINAGSTLENLADDFTPLQTASREIPREEALTGLIATVDGRRFRWGPEELPDRALPVYGAQILSSVTALLLCFSLCAISWWNHRDGVVMMVGFAAYAVVRFVLEVVRVDEAGQFGTALSISQWVSVFVFSASMLGLWWIYRSPPNASLNAQPSSGS